jgi:CHAD domain-containing protein
MSFELRPGSSLRKNLRRVVRKQVEVALEGLTLPVDTSREDGVHDARKAFKKVRAILRLVRPAIGDRTYQEANQALRDASRPLSAVRDAKVLIELTEKLAAKFKKRISGPTLGKMRRALEENALAVRQRVTESEDSVADVVQRIRRWQAEIKHWTDVPDKWSSLGKGLMQTYRRASRDLAQASAEPTSENLHQWRKQMKYLRYQLELLRPLWPERLKELAGDARRLGELLGDDHDLVVLEEVLARQPEKYGPDLKAIVAVIVDRQAELRKKAFALGGRFFARDAKEFARPLKVHWKTWGKTAAAEAAA